MKSKSVLATKANQQQPSQVRNELWGGKKPFSAASPDKSSKPSKGDIYSLPGVPAKPTAAASKAVKQAPLRTGGIPVNRPNKTATAAAIERRMQELTESPLADVTQAYTGRGGFAMSPTVSLDSIML